MPGSTADVSAYRSVKFKFFVLNPTPLWCLLRFIAGCPERFFLLRIGNTDCTMVAAAPVLPVGYVVSASRIADRRINLVGYRLVDLMKALKL